MLTGCPVYSSPCPVHGFVHGGEAEALRAALEGLLADGEHTDEWPDAIRHMLDRIDAHDSLAYVEHRARDVQFLGAAGGVGQRCLYVGCNATATHEDYVECVDEEGGHVWTVCCLRHASPDAVPWAGPGRRSKLHP